MLGPERGVFGRIHGSQSGRDGPSAQGRAAQIPHRDSRRRGREPRGARRSPDSSPPPRIDKPTLDCAEKIFGVDFTEAEEEQAASAVNQNLGNFERLRELNIPLDTEPAITFRPYLPGQEAEARRDTWSEDQGHAAAPRLAKDRPAARGSSLDELAFLPITVAGPAHQEPSGLVDRADEDVPRTPQEARAGAELRRDADRGARAGAGGAGRSRDPRRPLQGTAARHPVGREGSRSPRRAFRPRGARRRFRTRCSTTTPRSSSGCGTRARSWSRSSRWARSRRAIAGSAARRRTRGTRERGSSGSSAGPGSATAAGLVGFAHRHRDTRLDHLAVDRERRRRASSDVRPRQPPRRDGVELDDGQDRADVPIGRRLRAGVQRHLRAGWPRRHRRGRAVRVESGRAALEAADRIRQERVRSAAGGPRRTRGRRSPRRRGRARSGRSGDAGHGAPEADEAGDCRPKSSSGSASCG